MAFKDLISPNDIQKYLLDVLSRMSKNGEKYLYHYTSFAAITNIITSGYIWLGLPKKMNDHLEGEFIESFDESNRICYMCFSQVEENLAMYKMYAPGPDGAMLVIPLNMAEKMIAGEEIPESNKTGIRVYIVRDNERTEETIPAFLHWQAIAYKELHSNVIRAGNAKNKNIKNPLNVKELAGYIKLHGWEYEREVRLVAKTIQPLDEGEKIALKLPEEFAQHINIITAPGFDKRLHQKEICKLKRLGVIIHESEFDGLVDIGGSIDDDANKIIAELKMENSVLLQRLGHQEEKNKQQEINHLVDIKQEMQEQLVDYSKIQTSEDHINAIGTPWVKFPYNNLILRDTGVNNPSYNNGLIKVEPYDFYDDGLLVFSSRGGGEITIRERDEKNNIIESVVDVYIVETIPFSRIYKLDMDGSKNYPYPTLYCRFNGTNPYEDEWYIDKKTLVKYTKEQIVAKNWETSTEEDNIEYSPTPIINTDRSKISLYACIMLLCASIDDGRIMVLPTLSNTSYIAGNRNMQRNQSPRELARWDDAVSQLVGQGYIKRIGRKDRIYSLTADGFNMADRFKEECNVDPQKSSADMLAQFGILE